MTSYVTFFLLALVSVASCELDLFAETSVKASFFSPPFHVFFFTH